MGSPPGDPAPSLLLEWEGHSVESLKVLWNLAHLEVFRVLGSTNDRAKTLAEGGTGLWAVVLAETQTRGRGRGGKGWDSPAGQGIWLSMVVPSWGRDADTLLPVRVALATAEVLEANYEGPGGPETGILLKWPNDLLLSGRKVGGILCEAVGGENVVVGVGLNVGQRAGDFPPDLRETAISLEEGFRAVVPRVELAGGVIQGIRRAVAGGGGNLREEELQAYLDRDVLMGERVESEVGGRGIALGITPKGSLILEKEGGALFEVRAGSVARIPR